MSKKSEDQELQKILKLLAALGGEATPVQTVKYSEQGKAFVMYNTKGEAYGGDFRPDAELGLDWLVEAAANGSLAQQFAVYEPVEPAILAERIGRFSDWKQVYPVLN